MTNVARAETAVFRGATPEVAEAIKTASAESGVSFSYLMTKAATESGFRPEVKASTSSATGLFQFIERTWLNMVRDHGDKMGLGEYADALESGRVDKGLKKEILDLRKDPKTSAMMAAQYACENRDYLQRSVGGTVGDTELYLAHFLGPGGASKFLKAYRADPNASAASVCPDAARANRSIFYDRGGARSLAEVYDRFAAKFSKCDVPTAVAAPAAPPRSGVQLASTWIPNSTVTAAVARTPAPASVSGMPAPTPAAFAARLFMSSLSMPGEPNHKPGAV